MEEVLGMESEHFTQHGSGTSFSFFTILVYLLAMAVAGYFAWKYTMTEASSTKKYGIIAGAVVGAWLLIYILRAMTINV